MKLTETGESRVNGYLFVLERSLKSFLPHDVARDAVREIESHLRERVMAADGAPNERESVERILAELGPPLRVAQAYSAERTIDEAVVTGRVVAVGRAIWQVALTTVSGFFAAIALFFGYASGVALLVVAALKPIFPDNVGIWTVLGIPIGVGARFPTPPAGTFHGGYWVMPMAAVAGLAALVTTHRVARKFLSSWRTRRVS